MTKFLLQRQGKWDGVPIPNVTANDLRMILLSFQKKATKSSRLAPEDLDGTNQELLESLQLYLEDEKCSKSRYFTVSSPP